MLCPLNGLEVNAFLNQLVQWTTGRETANTTLEHLLKFTKSNPLPHLSQMLYFLQTLLDSVVHLFLSSEPSKTKPNSMTDTDQYSASAKGDDKYPHMHMLIMQSNMLILSLSQNYLKCNLHTVNYSVIVR